MFDGLWQNIIWFIYSILQGILKFVDAILDVFLVVGGVNPLKNQDGSPAGELVTTLLNQDFVRNAYITIAVVAVVLLGIVVAYTSIKQDIKPSKEDVSKGKLIHRGLMSIVAILILPVFILVCVQLVNALTSTTIGAINGGKNQTIGSLIFESTMKLKGGVVIEDLKRLAESQFGDASLIYRLPTDVLKGYYDITQWEIFLAFLMGGILTYVFLLIGLNLVERVFSILLLYLLGPYVAAVSPLDDGARFNIWKEAISGKILSAGGTIIGIVVYMSVLSSSFIQDLNFGNSSFINTVGRFLIIIGGALVASKGGLLVSQLIGHGAGAAEAASQGNSFRSLMGGAMVTTKALGGILFGSKQARMFRDMGLGSGGGGSAGNGSKGLTSSMARAANTVRTRGLIGLGGSAVASGTNKLSQRIPPANNLRNVMRARNEDKRERRAFNKIGTDTKNQEHVNAYKQKLVQKDMLKGMNKLKNRNLKQDKQQTKDYKRFKDDNKK